MQLRPGREGYRFPWVACVREQREADNKAGWVEIDGESDKERKEFKVVCGELYIVFDCREACELPLELKFVHLAAPRLVRSAYLLHLAIGH